MKTTPVAYLLWLAGGCGLLGLHRFYLGRWVTGLIWLFTGGLFLIGGLVDLFLIPSMVQVENLARQLLIEAARNQRRDPDTGNLKGFANGKARPAPCRGV